MELSKKTPTLLSSETHQRRRRVVGTVTARRFASRHEAGVAARSSRPYAAFAIARQTVTRSDWRVMAV